MECVKRSNNADEKMKDINLKQRKLNGQRMKTFFGHIFEVQKEAFGHYDIVKRFLRIFFYTVLQST